MKELLDKFIALERLISQEKGDCSLFALFLREDAVDKWDLIVAAPFVDADRKEALAYISNQIQQRLTPEELSQLSRIVLVEQSNPTVTALNQAIRVQHSKAEVQNSNFFGLQIKHAYIITSQRVKVDAKIPA